MKESSLRPFIAVGGVLNLGSYTKEGGNGSPIVPFTISYDKTKRFKLRAYANRVIGSLDYVVYGCMSGVSTSSESAR